MQIRRTPRTRPGRQLGSLLPFAIPAARPPLGSGRMLPALAAAALLSFMACGDPTGPAAETVTIELEVSGGFVGVNFAIRVDGEEGVVTGLACTAGCDFRAGDVILGISASQITDLAAEIEDAGVFRHDGRDFGIQCCDQFEYSLFYERSFRDARLAGSSGALPEPIAAAVARVRALATGRLAAFVDFATTPDAWPADPLAIDSIAIDGSELTTFVTWSGGCRDHAVDLVFWNGFLESQPVQADAVLAHDARDDPCDALVASTRPFDLTRLRQAWHEAYGPGPGTVIVRVRAPGQIQPATVRYDF